MVYFMSVHSKVLLDTHTHIKKLADRNKLVEKKNMKCCFSLSLFP